MAPPPDVFSGCCCTDTSAPDFRAGIQVRAQDPDAEEQVPTAGRSAVSTKGLELDLVLKEDAPIVRTEVAAWAQQREEPEKATPLPQQDSPLQPECSTDTGDELEAGGRRAAGGAASAEDRREGLALFAVTVEAPAATSEAVVDAVRASVAQLTGLQRDAVLVQPLEGAEPGSRWEVRLAPPRLALAATAARLAEAGALEGAVRRSLGEQCHLSFGAGGALELQPVPGTVLVRYLDRQYPALSLADVLNWRACLCILFFVGAGFVEALFDPPYPEVGKYSWVAVASVMSIITKGSVSLLAGADRWLLTYGQVGGWVCWLAVALVSGYTHVGTVVSQPVYCLLVLLRRPRLRRSIVFTFILSAICYVSFLLLVRIIVSQLYASEWVLHRSFLQGTIVPIIMTAYNCVVPWSMTLILNRVLQVSVSGILPATLIMCLTAYAEAARLASLVLAGSKPTSTESAFGILGTMLSSLLFETILRTATWERLMRWSTGRTEVIEPESDLWYRAKLAASYICLCPALVMLGLFISVGSAWAVRPVTWISLACYVLMGLLSDVLVLACHLQGPARSLGSWRRTWEHLMQPGAHWPSLQPRQPGLPEPPPAAAEPGASELHSQPQPHEPLRPAAVLFKDRSLGTLLPERKAAGMLCGVFVSAVLYDVLHSVLGDCFLLPEACV